MKHRALSTHRIDAPDRHKRTDKQTNGRVVVVRSFVCLFVSLMEFDAFSVTQHKFRTELFAVLVTDANG